MPPKPRKPPPRRPGARNRNLLLALAGAAALVLVLVVASVLLAGGGDDETSEPTTTGEVTALFDGIPQSGALLGTSDAPVTFIQFEDLQCPVCRQYHDEGFPQIVSEYVRDGRVKLRFAGLAFLGPDSEKALSYVLAAGKQGKLWHLAAALYANQGGENSGWVTDDLLERLAGEVGLDWAQLQDDAAGSAVKREARATAAEAAQLQVPGTPTFFVQVGNQAPYPVQPSSFAIEDFRPILDDALGQ
jgi:protein-disulfide isomerase